MKYLVLGGCGNIGSEVVADLAATTDQGTQIIVADVNYEQAAGLAVAAGGDRVTPLKVDVRDDILLNEAVHGCDIVVNCTPGHDNVGILKAAIRWKAHYLDITGTLHVRERLALSDDARKAGVTAIIAMGATPGVTNVLAKLGAVRVGKAESIQVSFATYRPMAASPGLLSTVLREFGPQHAERFVYQDGDFVRVGPFEVERTIEFPEPVGVVRTFVVPHSETLTLPVFIPGINRVLVTGTWQAPAMNAVQVFSEYGLLGDQPILVDGHSVRPVDVISKLVCEKEKGYEGQWVFYLRVEVVGRDNDSTHRVVYTVTHPDWGPRTHARVTGMPTSIVAQAIAAGKVRGTGVLAPEGCVPADYLIAELDKRGFRIGEVVEEARYL